MLTRYGLPHLLEYLALHLTGALQSCRCPSNVPHRVSRDPLLGARRCGLTVDACPLVLTCVDR